MVEDMSLKAMAGRYLSARDDWRGMEAEVELGRRQLSARLAAARKTMTKAEKEVIKAMEALEFTEIRTGDTVLKKRYGINGRAPSILVDDIPCVD